MPPGIQLWDIWGPLLAQASRCDEKPVVDFAVSVQSQRQVALWLNQGQTSTGRGVWQGPEHRLDNLSWEFIWGIGIEA